MPIIKFKARGNTYIERVEVEKETAQSVWFSSGYGGGPPFRRAKRAELENYFDTWAEAKTFLVKQAEQEVVFARRVLEVANATLGNVMGLREPA